MIPKKALRVLLVIFFLFSCTFIVSAADAPARNGWFFGGYSFFRADLNTANGEIVGGSSILKPSTGYSSTASSSSFEFLFVPRFSLVSNGIPDAEISSLFASYSPNENLKLQIGRFAHTPGPSLVFSNTNYFSGPVSPERLIDGHESSLVPDNLFQVSYKRDMWKITGIVAPFRPSRQTVSPLSPLFPRKNIKESFDIEMLGVTMNTLNLRNISLVQENDEKMFDLNPAISIETGISGDFWNCTFSCFEGLDRSPVLASKINKLITIYNNYDIDLRYEAARIRSFGISSEMRRSYFSVWLDASFTDGRYFLKGDPYESGGEWQAVQPVQGIEYTAGFSLDSSGKKIEYGMEVKTLFPITNTDDLFFPFLHRAFYSYLEAALWFDWLKGNISAVYSLSDGSYIISPSIMISTKNNYDLLIRSSFPFGNDKTELGQFAKNKQIFISFSVAY